MRHGTWSLRAATRALVLTAAFAALAIRPFPPQAAAAPKDGDPAAPQGNVSLGLTKTTNAPLPVPAGQPFSFTLVPTWSGGAPNTLVIEDTLPRDLHYLSHVCLWPTTLTQMAIGPVDSWGHQANRLTFTLSGITSASSTGCAITLTINAEYWKGTTCDNGVENAARMHSVDVSGVASADVVSNQVSILPASLFQWQFGHGFHVGGALDNDTWVKVYFSHPGTSDGQDMTSLTVRDAFPTNTRILEVTNLPAQWLAYDEQHQSTLTTSAGTVTFGTNGFIADALSNRLVIEMPATAPRQSAWQHTNWTVIYVRVRFETALGFGVGPVSWPAHFTGTTPCEPFGPTSPQAMLQLQQPMPASDAFKYLQMEVGFPPNNANYVPTFAPRCCADYVVRYRNTGNVAQTGVNGQFRIVDDLPHEVGTHDIYTDTAINPVTVAAYAWDPVANACSTTPLFTQAVSGSGWLSSSNPPLAALLAANDVCRVVWTYPAPIPPMAGYLAHKIRVCVRPNSWGSPSHAVLPPVVATNSVSLPDNQPGPFSWDLETKVDAAHPLVLLRKGFLGKGCPSGPQNLNGPFLPGDKVRFRIAVTNAGNAPATNSRISDLLPAGFTYAGNERYYFPFTVTNQSLPDVYQPSCANPTSLGGALAAMPSPTLSPAAGGATLIEWSPFTLPFRCNGTLDYLVIDFDATIDAPTPPGVYWNKADFTASNLAVAVPQAVAAVQVSSVDGLSAEKAVRVQGTSGWSQHVVVGAGGAAVEFRLLTKNIGNRKLENLRILDVLPWSGDAEVFPSLSTSPWYGPRGSTFGLPIDPANGGSWLPSVNLVSSSGQSTPVSPTWYTLRFATANDKNPARLDPALGFCQGPAHESPGAGPGTWSTATPTAPSYAFTLQMTGAAQPLGPGEAWEVIVPVRVPAGVPAGTPNAPSRACNNFGVTATVHPAPVGGAAICLPTQSMAACVTVENGTLEVRKYRDVNCDGRRQPPTGNDPGDPLEAGFSFTVSDGTTTYTGAQTAVGVTTYANLAPGTYTVTEAPKGGWIGSSPVGGSTTVQVVAGQTAVVEFLNCPGEPCDFLFHDEQKTPNCGFGVTVGLPGWHVTAI